MSRVLLFNLPPEKARRIGLAALRLGLRPIEVRREDFGLTLGTLLGDEVPVRAAEADDFTDEMLVMEQLSSPLLNAMRAEGAAVALKAVVTEHNRGWTAAQLCRELRLEHAAMQAQFKKPVHKHKKRK